MAELPFEVHDEDGIPCAVFRGPSDNARVTERIFHVAGIAKARGAPGLLLDIRQSTDENYRVTAVKQAENPDVFEQVRGLRIALLGKPGDERLDFVENVAVNRGITVRSFTDREAAMDWVRG